MIAMKNPQNKRLATTKVVLQMATLYKPVPTRAQFLKWVKATLSQQSASGEVTIRVVDEEESAHLNEQYRHKKGPTNVLAFPFISPLLPIKIASLGDVAICAPLVQKEALAQEKAEIAHWAHLTIHATLHLLGYDHIEKEDARIMERIEVTILEGLGFNNPY